MQENQNQNQNNELSFAVIFNIIYVHKMLLTLAVILGIASGFFYYNFKYEYKYEININIVPIKKLYDFPLENINRLYEQKFLDLNVQKMLILNKLTLHIHDLFQSEMSNLALSTSNINCAMKYFKDPRYERIQYKHTIFDQYILFDLYRDSTFQNFSKIPKKLDIGYKVDDRDNYQLNMQILSNHKSFDKKNMDSILLELNKYAVSELFKYTNFCFNLLNDEVNKFLRVFNFLYLDSVESNVKNEDVFNNKFYKNIHEIIQNMVVVNIDEKIKLNEDFMIIDHVSPILDLNMNRPIVPLGLFVTAGVILALMFAFMLILIIRIFKR
tara:strand:+ start:349 stop:1326 length:978 start_codon:yes stop_codon:yes gene_type:complete